MNPVYPRQLVMMRIGVRKRLKGYPAPIAHMADRIARDAAKATGSTLAGWRAAIRFADAASKPSPWGPAA